MRGQVLTVAVVIAGCEQSPGLQLEVGVEDTSITSIELIVGAPCEGCPKQMAAPNLEPRTTSIFSSPHPAAWFADVDGTFTGFFLHVDGDDDQRIPVLGIVGYNSAKQPIAYTRMHEVLVPAGDESYTRVQLKPIIPIDDTVPTDDRERVTVWRHPEQREPSCMMVEHWSGGVVTTGAIVPPTDPDCDHVLQAECAPYIPEAMNSGGTLADATCMVVAPFSAAPVCVFAGPSCTDGSPLSTSTCKRLDVDHCLPASLCECAPADLGCLFGKFASGTGDGTVTAFHCTAPVSATGELCGGTTTATIDGSPFLAGARCKSIHFLAGFLSSMSLSDSQRFDATVNLKLGNFAADLCTVQMSWEGAVLNPTNTHTTITAVDIELDSGRHLDVPVRIETTPNCTEKFSCTLIGPQNESLYLCGQPMM